MEQIPGTNTIIFTSPINDESATKLINKLLTLESEIKDRTKTLKRKFDDFEKSKDDKDKDKGYKNKEINMIVSTDPIILRIKSNGGHVHSAFTIIDAIKEMSIPVHTVCTGLVASAGTLISLAGTKRFMTKHAYMLIHEIRSGSWGTYSNMQDNFENSTNLMNRIKNYYIINTKITEEDITDILKKDLYWDADVCLEKGLIDEII
jgi:ATP-dependent protease ClpP protease subunit